VGRRGQRWARIGRAGRSWAGPQDTVVPAGDRPVVEDRQGMVAYSVVAVRGMVAWAEDTAALVDQDMVALVGEGRSAQAERCTVAWVDQVVLDTVARAGLVEQGMVAFVGLVEPRSLPWVALVAARCPQTSGQSLEYPAFSPACSCRGP